MASLAHEASLTGFSGSVTGRKQKRCHSVTGNWSQGGKDCTWPTELSPGLPAERACLEEGNQPHGRSLHNLLKNLNRGGGSVFPSRKSTLNANWCQMKSHSPPIHPMELWGEQGTSPTHSCQLQYMGLCFLGSSGPGWGNLSLAFPGTFQDPEALLLSTADVDTQEKGPVPTV